MVDITSSWTLHFLLGLASSPSAGCAGFDFRGGYLDRIYNLWIGRTATQIACQIVPYLLVARIGVLPEESLRHQDETGRAESALECTGLDEGLLYRVKFSRFVEMLHRHHVGGIEKCRKIKTGGDRLVVDQNGAATAESLPAALPCAGQCKPGLQHFDDVLIW